MCQFWIQPSATLLSTHQSVILGAKLSTVPLRYLAVLADGLPGARAEDRLALPPALAQEGLHGGCA